MGADLVVSEMVSAEGLLVGGRATRSLLRFMPEERPIGIQLFGASPASLAEAARVVEGEAGPDFIDLNAGCPVRKVVEKNGGASLLRDRDRFAAIVTAMTAAVATPVTVKIRSAWNQGEWVDVDYARIAEDAGAAAVTLHPRTRAMQFSGAAMWDRIALVKRSVAMPVIGNGDVTRPGDARRMIAETGCDAVMIGRGVMGNPWLFGQCRCVLDGREPFAVTPRMRLAMAREHLAAAIEETGEKRAAAEMKKHVAWYLKGLPGVAALRAGVFRCASSGEMRALLDEYEGMMERVEGE